MTYPAFFSPIADAGTSRQSYPAQQLIGYVQPFGMSEVGIASCAATEVVAIRAAKRTCTFPRLTIDELLHHRALTS